MKPTDTGNASREAENESLRGDYVGRRNQRITICVTRREPASGQRRNIKEVTLNSDHVHGVDSR